MDMCPRFERYRRERENNLTEWEVVCHNSLSLPSLIIIIVKDTWNEASRPQKGCQDV